MTITAATIRPVVPFTWMVICGSMAFSIVVLHPRVVERRGLRPPARAGNRILGSLPELFAQGQGLLLIGGPDIGAIDFVRTGKQRDIVQPAHQLSMVHLKRHFVCPDF